MSHLPRAGRIAGFHSGSAVLHTGANNQNHHPWPKKLTVLAKWGLSCAVSRDTAILLGLNCSMEEKKLFRFLNRMQN